MESIPQLDTAARPLFQIESVSRHGVLCYFLSGRGDRPTDAVAERGSESRDLDCHAAGTNWTRPGKTGVGHVFNGGLSGRRVSGILVKSL